MKDINKIVSAHWFKLVMFVVAEFILLTIVFSVGMKIGFKKANFSNDFGINYERNFAGPPRGPMGPGGPMRAFRDFEGGGFRNSHGTAGTIVSVADSAIVIKDRDNKENTVSVNEKTLIKSRDNDIKINDLKNGQRIVVIGKPSDNGTIAAELVRVFDVNNN